MITHRQLPPQIWRMIPKGIQREPSCHSHHRPECKHLVPPAPVGPALFGATSQVGSGLCSLVPHLSTADMLWDWVGQKVRLSFLIPWKKMNFLASSLAHSAAQVSGLPFQSIRDSKLWWWPLDLSPPAQAWQRGKGRHGCSPRFQRMGPSERVMGQGPQTQRAMEPRQEWLQAFLWGPGVILPSQWV